MERGTSQTPTASKKAWGPTLEVASSSTWPRTHGDTEAQRGQMPHTTSTGASPTLKCSRFIISGRHPGPNWSHHLVSGPRSNLGMGTSIHGVAMGLHLLSHEELHFPQHQNQWEWPQLRPCCVGVVLHSCHLTLSQNPGRSTRVIQISQEEAEAQRGEANCPRSPSLPEAESGDNPLLRVLVRTGFQNPRERKRPMPEVPNHTEHSRPQWGPTQAGRP